MKRRTFPKGNVLFLRILLFYSTLDRKSFRRSHWGFFLASKDPVFGGDFLQLAVRTRCARTLAS